VAKAVIVSASHSFKFKNYSLQMQLFPSVFKVSCECFRAFRLFVGWLVVVFGYWLAGCQAGFIPSKIAFSDIAKRFQSIL